MSNLIKITPEEVSRVAADFAKQRAEAEAQINMLQQRISGIEPRWDGMTSEQFMADFAMAQQMMKEYLERHQIVEDWLKKIAQRFTEADQQGIRR
jgi:WXG100 family type VII secretion target